jgi:hypothetical protein
MLGKMYLVIADQIWRTNNQSPPAPPDTKVLTRKHSPPKKKNARVITKSVKIQKNKRKKNDSQHDYEK